MANLNGQAVNEGQFETLWDEFGVKKKVKFNDDGSFDLLSEQNLAPVMGHLHDLRENTTGYDKAKELKHVMHIPQVLLDYFRHVEGWEPFDPANVDRLKKVINDPDFALLRASTGQVAVTNGILR